MKAIDREVLKAVCLFAPQREPKGVNPVELLGQMRLTTTIPDLLPAGKLDLEAYKVADRAMYDSIDRLADAGLLDQQARPYLKPTEQGEAMAKSWEA